MNASLVLLGVLALLLAGFSFVFVKDYVAHKEQLEPETNFVTSGIIGTGKRKRVQEYNRERVQLLVLLALRRRFTKNGDREF